MSDELNKDERLQAARKKFEEQKRKMKKKRAHATDFTKVVSSPPASNTSTAPPLTIPKPTENAPPQPSIVSNSSTNDAADVILSKTSEEGPPVQPPRASIHDYENDHQLASTNASASVPVASERSEKVERVPEVVQALQEYSAIPDSEQVEGTVSSEVHQETTAVENPQLTTDNEEEPNAAGLVLEPASAEKSAPKEVPPPDSADLTSTAQETGPQQSPTDNEPSSPVRPSLPAVSSPPPKRYQLTAEDLFGPTTTAPDEAFLFSHPSLAPRDPKQAPNGSQEQKHEQSQVNGFSQPQRPSLPQVDPMELFGDAPDTADSFTVPQPVKVEPAIHSSSVTPAVFEISRSPHPLQSLQEPRHPSLDFDSIFGAPPNAQTDFDGLFNSNAQTDLTAPPVKEQEVPEDTFNEQPADPSGSSAKEKATTLETNQGTETFQKESTSPTHTLSSEVPSLAQAKQLTVEDLFGAPGDDSGNDALFGPYSSQKQPALVKQHSAHVSSILTPEEISITPTITQGNTMDLFEVDLNYDEPNKVWNVGLSQDSNDAGLGLSESNSKDLFEQPDKALADVEIPENVSVGEEIVITPKLDDVNDTPAEAWSPEEKAPESEDVVEPVKNAGSANVEADSVNIGTKPLTEPEHITGPEPVTEVEPAVEPNHVNESEDAKDTYKEHGIEAGKESKDETHPDSVLQSREVTNNEIERLKAIIKEQEETIKSQEATIKRQREENTNIKLSRMDLNDRVADLEDEIEDLKALLAGPNVAASAPQESTDSNPLSSAQTEDLKKPDLSDLFSAPLLSAPVLSAPPISTPPVAAAPVAVPAPSSMSILESKAAAALGTAHATFSPPKTSVPATKSAAMREVDIDALFSDITNSTKSYIPLSSGEPFELKLKNYSLEAEELFPDVPKQKDPVTSTIEDLFTPTIPATPVGGDTEAKRQAASNTSDFRERLMVWKGWQVDMTQWGGSEAPQVAL